MRRGVDASYLRGRATELARPETRATAEPLARWARKMRIDGRPFSFEGHEYLRAIYDDTSTEPVRVFDSLAQSGIAELGNVITGLAASKLARIGYDVTISPPTLLMGRGTALSTLDLPRLFVPLYGEEGQVGLHLALATRL